MWLSVSFFIGALDVIQGLHFSDTLNIFIHPDPCVAKIILCDHYRHPFSPHGEQNIGMFTNIEDLKKVCKLQTPYVRCMTQAEKFCEQTSLSPIAAEMIKNRRFPADICRPFSPWQQLYLREASCLNSFSRNTFVHCIDKMIGISNLNSENSLELGCKSGRAIVDCSAATVQEKCGYYSGYILKKFFMFHSIFDYKCVDLGVDIVVEKSLSSTPNYDMIEEIFNILEEKISYSEPIERTGSTKNTYFEEIGPDHSENYVSDNPLSEESISVFDFNLVADELLNTKDSFSNSFDSDAESEGKTIEPDKFDFPPLPKHNYIHKNRTTFALYEDLEMGHMKYIGCGEADVFWVILSAMRSKYCTLMDLELEYSESIFKCTIRIDAPCSSELTEGDGKKNAEVFHRRYVVTVLTPPNNQRLEDMAVMNVHYLKIYPSSSWHVPEKNMNLWTDQAKKETKPMDRKGPLENEDYYNNIPYQHGNGSGQKKNTDTVKNSHHLDEDEYSEENEDWDYYPLEEDNDIYFPELLTNDVIYIEDDKGDLISLHDQRSPIYSNSLYQPHALFRPRIGAIPASTHSWKSDEVRTNRNKKLVQSAIFEDRMSEYKDKTSEISPDQQEYCSAEESPCLLNSQTISKFGIKPDSYINHQDIKTFDQLYGLDMKPPRKITSSFKLIDGIDEKPHLATIQTYVVSPSSKIELPKSTESRQTENSRNPLEEEDGINIDIADDSRHLDPEYSSTLTSAPDYADSETDYVESIGEYYSNGFTQAPYN